MRWIFCYVGVVDSSCCCAGVLCAFAPTIYFLGVKRTVTRQEVPCRVVDDKGRRPPAQDSVPSIYVVVVVAAFAAFVVVVDAVVDAHPHTHTSHTLRDTQAHTHARTLTHAPTTKPKIFNIHVANGSSALLPFRRAPGGLAVRRFGIASAPAGVPGTHSWRSLGM